ncbi:hypothetical protein A1O7_10021 [Cladophialophora yegresii CBS 114405]|uniref:HAUS augmin-like complex subunit 4 n=1 Tax=Cladophialophora yegresii CBS 114405 TaxID=1182544 RepID=W9VNT7_9EURO|nr:uncharacterized protein A1O7_10021 [Cladophialophora yegresii CBS 114405]EXJ54680.1 hypothetical protein A1O7_10021 [Cladophialophora yegresii CBS 114405]
MIPIIRVQDLEAYPSFASTWAYITSSLLEADGSGKAANETRARARGRGRSWEGIGRGRGRGWYGSGPAPAPGEGGGARQGEQDRRRGDGQHEETREGESDGSGSESGDGGEEGRRATDAQEEDRDGESDDTRGPHSHAVRDGEENWSLPSSSAGLEELLLAVRARRMRDGILREILSEVAYLDEDEGVEEGSRSEKSSRIPVPAPVGTRLEYDQDNTNTDAGDESVKAASSATHGQGKGGLSVRLPTRLRDLALIISAYLDAAAGLDGRSESGEDEDLLSEDIDLFRASISNIAEVVSLRAIASESSLSALSQLASERDVDSHLGLSSLFSSLRVQVEKLNALRTNALPSSLARLASTLHSLLTLQRTLLHLQLRYLETSKHGVLSRYNGARVAFLSTVAQTMALKTQVLVLEAWMKLDMSPETEEKRALARARSQQMEKEEREINERIKTLEGVVGEYEALDPGGRGAAGGEIMAKLGRRYGEIEAEMETVKRDIDMLERKPRT